MQYNNKDLTNLFLVTQQNKFSLKDTPYLRNTMEELDKDKLLYIQSLDYKDPQMIFFISFFFGFLGIDRFLIGNYILGILKLITLGGCGLWYIIDFFLIINSTKKYNLDLFNKNCNFLK